MMNNPRLRLPLITLLFVSVSGCVSTETNYDVPVSPIASTVQVEEPESAEDRVVVTADELSDRIGVEPLRSLGGASPGPARSDLSARFRADDALSVSVEEMPLQRFLHYAFGELLNVNYVISEGIPNLQSPVTLSLREPVSSRRLYTLVTELAAERDVGVTFRDGIFYLHPMDRRAKGDVFVGLGSRPRDVPDVPGPILQVIPLRYGVSASIERTLRDIVGAQVVGDTQQSALFVTGERFEILRALDIVEMLDQPARRGRHVGLVRLTFVGPEEFMESVVELLRAEGVPAGVGSDAQNTSVAFVPIESVGAVAVFAANRELLDRVDYWVRRLDEPGRGAERQYFIYTPRYARADELGRSLAPLLGEPGALPETAESEPRDTRSALRGGGPDAVAMGETAARTVVDRALRSRRDDYGGRRSAGLAGETVSVRSENLTMSVDLRSNALIFNTTGALYQSLLPMIRRLDTAPRQILLDATIAEVTLTDEFALGVEWALERGRTSYGTEGGLGLPDGGGFITYVGGDGFIQGRLSASNRLVNVLSSPSLVVRDGVSANISVGNDIPTVGATFFDPIESDRQVTTVQYRKTGVDLTVTPTLNAQGLVVMNIVQNISKTVEGGSEVEGAPAIFERSVATEVVARSGETVLLGGLISENNNDTTAKVPGLGDIPLLGRLFRSDQTSKERTELVVLITPRVLDERTRWDSIRNRLDNALRHLNLDDTVPVYELIE
ncbi:MAG: general secretion pathway protein GspD [Gammaproteobacteria bacterium]